MAKIGEGDPRWLVKDMGESGRNVNGWHWTEKDCLSWCKSRLNQLFDGAKLVSGPIEVTGGQVDTITGEAFLNNRKNKVIAR
jgi:activator of HSP90 ATPase